MRRHALRGSTAACIASVAAIAALLNPAGALAHRDHRHHHRGRVTRSSHHRAATRHARTRIVHLRPAGGPPASPGAPVGPSSAGAPEPGETPALAGTVVSFEHGMLTLKLSDGTTMTGAVTEETDITCGAADATPPAGGDGTASPDHPAGVLPADGGVTSAGGESGEDSAGRSEGDGSEEDDAAEPPSCGEAALVAGAGVLEAQLRVGPTGSTFESIGLAG